MAVSGIQQNIDKLQSLTSSLPALIAKWKKAKRKEQCRQAQAKFQKRKREKLQALIDSIASLNREIKQLKTRKAKIMKQPNPHVRLITYFYKALQADVKEQQLPDVRNYEQTYGCTPALQVLADLQREEFDSMESLKLHWLWYRLQFRQFELSITSYECLVAGEPVIVKASGSLRLGIECEDKRLGTKRHVNVCPVLQQFEFEIGEQIVRRITSEVSLVSGEEQASPMAAVNTLSFLSRGLCFH
ncbi:hypothetical protein PHYBOEH_007142 [Phytophthora boehmeriae]|uniref:Bzip transcription factor n=1 Tax=Phytophthora boehmeriae TaxID=109152 RepID=A0A8T1W9Z8_9STRA|nr:hypothetical protein PHYBOEH_007142 [Phytophthora boehmeriae]